MSWYGTHPQSDKHLFNHIYTAEAGHIVGPCACKMCKYRVKVCFALKKSIFSDFTCSRCGLKFPAEKIERELWIMKMRGEI